MIAKVRTLVKVQLGAPYADLAKLNNSLTSLAKCVDNIGQYKGETYVLKTITIGKVYNVQVYSDIQYLVTGDDGSIRMYNKKYFRLLNTNNEALKLP